jgi:F-type H+-transporting ATPase subunit gamma
MADTLENLKHKTDIADELNAVVKTMKALAASNINQFENAVQSLQDYYRTTELGLVACFRHFKKNLFPALENKNDQKGTGIIIFGSDQGLVGQFNTVLLDFMNKKINSLNDPKFVWCIGERIHAELEALHLTITKAYAAPASVKAITPLIGNILLSVEAYRTKGELSQVYVFYNKPFSKISYESHSQQLFPLNNVWESELTQIKWSTKNLPEVVGNEEQTVIALVREYLFVSLFKACTESLAAENASRLAAMQRAEKNINELLDDLTHAYHQLRQSSIDEELFDVVSGFEALNKESE